MRITLRLGALVALLLLVGVGFWLVLLALSSVGRGHADWGFVYVSVIVGGAVGGFVASLDSMEMNKVRLPRIDDDDIQLGTFGNILVGAVAGFVFFGLFGPTDAVKELVDKIDDKDGFHKRTLSFLRVVGMSALAGFAGRALIQKMAESLSLRDKIAKAESKAIEAATIAQEAASRAMVSMGEQAQEQDAYALAADLFEKAVEINPKNVSAKVSLAVALLDVVLLGKMERADAKDKRVVRADSLMKQALDDAGADRPFVLAEQAKYEFIKFGPEPTESEIATIKNLVEGAREKPNSLSDYAELARKGSLDPSWSQFRKREWNYSQWLKSHNLLSAD